MMLLFVALAGGTAWWFTQLPTGFMPQEDQGYAILGVQLPDAASQVRTRAVVRKLSEILRETPGVENWFMIGGMSILDQAAASNGAAFYVTFAPWSQRTGRDELSQNGILKALTDKAKSIREAMIFAFPPPAIQGLGVAGGFQLQLEDRAGVGLKQLQQIADELIRAGNAQTGLKNLQTSFRAEVPIIYADVDRVKAKSLGVPLERDLRHAAGDPGINVRQ